MKTSVALLLGLFVTVLKPSLQKNIAPRIIGGEKADAGQFPFAAAIYVQKPSSTTFCGGALISNLWVLTAGHCIYNATLMTIQLGSNTLRDPDPNRLTLATDNLVIHPLFNPTTLENDIGLVMFRMTISLNDYIKPTSFFPIADLSDSEPVTTFGWGQINDEISGLNNELHYVKLATITNEECKLTFGSQILDSMVCVAGNYNEGICRGDSGSPLIQNVGGGHTLIVGVASFLSTSGCENSDPSGYVRVFQYKEWITSVTEIE